MKWDTQERTIKELESLDYISFEQLEEWAFLVKMSLLGVEVRS